MATYNNYSNYNGYPGSERIEFKLIEQLGVLDTHKSGWSREVNIVAWNGNPPKFDIRDWDPEHTRMSRGITLYENEAIKLTRLLARRLEMDPPQNRMQSRRSPVPARAPQTPAVSSGRAPEPVEDRSPEREHVQERNDILFDPEEEVQAETMEENYEEEPLAQAAGNEPF